MSIAWQLIPYCVLTISEILVSTTGLEFAYTQAPAHLKSLITSFWNLTIFAGNMLVAAITFFLSNGESANAISTHRFILCSPPWWRSPTPSGRAGMEKRNKESTAVPRARGRVNHVLKKQSGRNQHALLPFPPAGFLLGKCRKTQIT